MKLGSSPLLLLPFLSAVSATCNVDAPQSVDGSCNNLANPLLGASFTAYRRGPEGAQYEDGVQIPVQSRPEPRAISNAVGKEDTATAQEDPIPHNMMAVMFGQFINHDFNNNDMVELFTRTFEEDLLISDPNDEFCIAPPPLPPVFRCDPANGPYFIQYRKSAGSTSTGQFEVTNRGTSYLDLGNIYGNTNANATALRTMADGKLKTSDYLSSLALGGPPVFFSNSDLPPSRASTGLNTNTLNLDFPDDQILTAGDFRLNNNVALAAFQTLFLREHNRLATEYLEDNPAAPDEEIFQASRRRNIAQYQKIVLEDYVPAEFGPYFTSVVGPYTGYDDAVDASTGAAFATAAFRYGHSAVRGYKPLGSCGDVSTTPVTPFVFPGSDIPNIGRTGGPFNVLTMLYLAGNAGFETVLRGLVATRTRPIDTKIVDSIRTTSFPLAQALGVDLLSFDIQRGRLNGIPNYDSLRQAYHTSGSMYGSSGCGAGLASQTQDDPLVCFIRLVSDGPPGQATAEETDLATKLRDLYGKVNKIDGVIGLLSESKVAGTSFGETMGRIIADQYQRARDGDRFWYENVYGEADKAAIKAVTMKTLFERNFDLTDFPEEVFLAPADFAGDLAATCNVLEP